MLAMADGDGAIYATVPGLADRARVTLQQCEAGLEVFQQPDRYSGSQEAQGRRIRVIDGGWQLINHFKYRVLLSAADRREKDRDRKKKKRAEYKKVSAECPHVSANVREIPQAEAEAEAEAEAVSTTPSPFRRDKDLKTCEKIAKPYIAEIYKLYPRKEARRRAYKTIAAALARLLNGEEIPKDLFHSMDDAVVYLKQRVALYRQAREGQDRNYTPYPATWFNDSRYLDDESEWWKRGEQPSKSQQRIVNNGETILEALFGQEAPTGGDSSAEGTNSSRGKAMGASASRLLGS